MIILNEPGYDLLQGHLRNYTCEFCGPYRPSMREELVKVKAIELGLQLLTSLHW